MPSIDYLFDFYCFFCNDSKNNNIMIEELYKIWFEGNSHKKILVLTNAEVSVANGIPIYKSPSRFWGHLLKKEILSFDTLSLQPELLINWVNDKRAKIQTIEPTSTHYAITRLENFFKNDFCLITESIDGLHKTAGTLRNLEFQGNINNDIILNVNDIAFPAANLYDLPTNVKGQFLRPDILLDGEKIDKKKIIQANILAKQADIVLIIGSSFENEIIEELPLIAKKFNDAKIIEINETEKTCFFSDLYINGNFQEITPLLINLIIDLEKGFREKTNNNFRKNN